MDRGGTVTSYDTMLVRQRLNTSTRRPGAEPFWYSIFADVNAAGRIDRLDLALVRLALVSQPTPATVSPAGGGVTRELFRPEPAGY